MVVVVGAAFHSAQSCAMEEARERTAGSVATPAFGCGAAALGVVEAEAEAEAEVEAEAEGEVKVGRGES